jgi:hypothetical protein
LRLISPATTLSASGVVQPRRRIVKWVALFAAIPLTLLSSYIGAWLLCTWWWAGKLVFINGSYQNVVVLTPKGPHPIPQLFDPIERHIIAGRLGGELLASMQNEVIRRSLPPQLPPPEPEPPLFKEIDRLLMDVPK